MEEMKESMEMNHDFNGQHQGDVAAYTRASWCEEALVFFQAQLWGKEGKVALRYLEKRRRYNREEIRGMGLGFFPYKNKVREHLGDIFSRLGLDTRGFGKTHKLVIPYRDPAGSLKGFILRRLDEERPKFIYSQGTERDTLFNLNTVNGQKNLLIVEGYFDALIATQRGIPGVVAIGGAKLTEKMLEESAFSGVTGVTLIPDNDLMGLKMALKSLDLIRGKGFDPFVLELPEKYKDLDEFLRREGVEAFEELRKHQRKAAEWNTKELLSRRNNIKVQVRTMRSSVNPSRIYYIKRDHSTSQEDSDS